MKLDMLNQESAYLCAAPGPDGEVGDPPVVTPESRSSKTARAPADLPARLRLLRLPRQVSDRLLPERGRLVLDCWSSAGLIDPALPLMADPFRASAAARSARAPCLPPRTCHAPAAAASWLWRLQLDASRRCPDHSGCWCGVGESGGMAVPTYLCACVSLNA